MNRRPMEPVFWLLFSGGGMAAALLIPVLLVVFGLALPLGWLTPDPAHLAAVVGNPLVRLVLLGLSVLALFHAAHRLRYTFVDGLQLKRLAAACDVLCYGGAAAGSVLAAYLLATAG